MTTYTYDGNNPNSWIADGADLGADIGGDTATTGIEMIGSGTVAENYIALDGSSPENLDSNASAIKNIVNNLQTNYGLSGIGVGEIGTAQSNKAVSTNGEIQSDVGIGAADRLFIDFNRLTNLIDVELDLFYTAELLSWGGQGAEQMKFQLLREVPTDGDVEIGGNQYVIVQHNDLYGLDATPGADQDRANGDTNDSDDASDNNGDGFLDRDWSIKTASGTRRWGASNPGQEAFSITSSNSFDAIMLSGYDYNPFTPQWVKDGIALYQDPSADVPVGTTPIDPATVDVSDYLLSKIILEETQPSDPQAETTHCFGGSNVEADWYNTTFAYNNLGSGWVQEGDAGFNFGAIDPLNYRDLITIGNLPVGASGLGVGSPNGPNTNDPLPNNPELQGVGTAQVTEGDSLRMDFSTPDPVFPPDDPQGMKAFSAKVNLSLFYSEEIVGGSAYPEQMKFQLMRKEGNSYVNVTDGVTAITHVDSNGTSYNTSLPTTVNSGSILVTAANTGTFAYKTGTSDGNPGNMTFTIASDKAFDTIVFKGADYGGNPPATTTDVSDYLVKQVCLTGYEGDGPQTLNAAAGSDTFIFNSIADGVDTINNFDPSEDTIIINKAGFGDDIVSAAILGNIDIGDFPDYFNYNSGSNTLTVDLDGTGAKAPVPLAILPGVSNLTELFVGYPPFS